MIPRAVITAWRAKAPWSTDEQVEQDLAICRALVDIFSWDGLASQLAFRGGTALHKLFLTPASRYSEDIDLVQVEAGPIGPVMTVLRARLDPWLGKPGWKQSAGRVTFYYRFDSEIPPITRMRLKVEICTREHFSVLGLVPRDLVVENSWFSGTASIATYRLEELLATKLRALYQRKRGRDLFDLALALEREPELNLEAIAEGFRCYLGNEGLKVTRTEFERNLDEKLADPRFGRDVEALLSTEGLAESFDVADAARAVREALLARI